MVPAILLSAIATTYGFAADNLLKDGFVAVTTEGLPLRERAPFAFETSRPVLLGTVPQGRRVLVMETKTSRLSTRAEVYAKICELKSSCDGQSSPCERIGWVYAGPKGLVNEGKGMLKAPDVRAPEGALPGAEARPNANPPI